MPARSAATIGQTTIIQRRWRTIWRYLVSSTEALCLPSKLVKTDHPTRAPRLASSELTSPCLGQSRSSRPQLSLFRLHGRASGGGGQVLAARTSSGVSDRPQHDRGRCSAAWCWAVGGCCRRRVYDDGG